MILISVSLLVLIAVLYFAIPRQSLEFFKWFFTIPHNMPRRWTLIRATLTGLSPAIVSFISYESLKKSALSSQDELQDVLQSYLNDHNALLILIFGVPAIVSFLCELYEYFSQMIYFENNLPSGMYVDLISGLNDIVGKKVQRFSSCLDDIGDGAGAGTIFKKITDPKSQIDQIVGQLYAHLRLITKERLLTIALVDVENNKAVEYIRYMPADNHPTLDLSNEKKFFNHVAVKKNIISIPKISKELKRAGSNYAPSESPKEGSIIGIPVLSKNKKDCNFVITVRSSKVNLFDKRFIKAYTCIIDAYVKRIELESLLIKLREKAS